MFLFSLSLLLIVNLKITFLISNTFNFWIKVVNLTMINVAIVVLANTSADEGFPYWVHILRQTTSAPFLILIFFYRWIGNFI